MLTPSRHTVAFTLALIAAGPSLAGPDKAVAELLRQRLETAVADDKLMVGTAELEEPALLAELYVPGSFEPLWSSPEVRRQALDAVLGSVAHGLVPSDYHAAELAPLVALAGRGALGPAQLVDLDLLLSSGYVRLLYTLHFGKLDPEDLEPAWNYGRELSGPDAVRFVLDTIAGGRVSAAVGEVAPQAAAYQRLRDVLAGLREADSAGGWPSVPDGPTLRAGAAGPRVAALRSRLAATGDLPDLEAGSDVAFDDRLGAAVRAFQSRHGLEPDGAVGPRTLAALNVPVAARIDQVRVNLERLRWVFRDPVQDFVVIDIAGFGLHLFEGRRPTWSTRIQVGRPFTATPVFRSEIRYLVFNPTWTVPASIARRDLIPRELEEPGSLAADGFRVLTPGGVEVGFAEVDWEAAASGRFPWLLRQAPGPKNALGRVKFMFPNEYSVYLHDTPSRRLFDRAERAFSSGCIRVENPLDLAERLLVGTPGWDRGAIDRAVASGRTTSVSFSRPMPVMFLYLTAVVDDSGRTQFRPDVYLRDPSVLEGLAAPLRVSPPRGLRESFADR